MYLAPAALARSMMEGSLDPDMSAPARTDMLGRAAAQRGSGTLPLGPRHTYSNLAGGVKKRDGKTSRTETGNKSHEA